MDELLTSDHRGGVLFLAHPVDIDKDIETDTQRQTHEWLLTDLS